MFHKIRTYKKIIFSVIAGCILVLGGTILTGSGMFGPKAAYRVNAYLDDLSRSPDTPPYLSLHYRLRCLRLALEPHQTQPIVFLGDSMTDNGHWKQLFPNETVINMGIGGDTTLGILHRLDQVVARKPSKIFLMVGTNDLCYNRTIADTLTNYDQILSRLQASLPKTQIYVESVLPFNDHIFPSQCLRTNSNIAALNEGIEALAKAHGLPYLDITDDFTNPNGRLDASLTVDGLHLNPAGYEIWHDNIYEQVKS